MKLMKLRANSSLKIKKPCQQQGFYLNNITIYGKIFTEQIFISLTNQIVSANTYANVLHAHRTYFHH